MEQELGARILMNENGQEDGHCCCCFYCKFLWNVAEIWKVASENGGDVAGSSSPSSASSSSCCYRLGSVAMDTQVTGPQ